MKKFKSKTLALVASAAALALVGTAAQAHLTTFGYLDNGNGTVTLFGEHWHGDLSSAYSANGGVHVSNVPVTLTVTVPWIGVINNVSIAGMGFTGYADTFTGISGAYQDWMYTAPLVLGNGTYDFYTGPNCCVDEMDSGAVRFTVSGITSVPDGDLGNAGIPEPATWAMMIMGFGLTGAAMRRRKGASLSIA